MTARRRRGVKRLGTCLGAGGMGWSALMRSLSGRRGWFRKEVDGCI